MAVVIHSSGVNAERRPGSCAWTRLLSGGRTEDRQDPFQGSPDLVRALQAVSCTRPEAVRRDELPGPLPRRRAARLHPRPALLPGLCAERAVEPLLAQRPHLELDLRWMQQHRLAPTTIRRRFTTPLNPGNSEGLILPPGWRPADPHRGGQGQVGVTRDCEVRAAEHGIWAVPLQRAKPATARSSPATRTPPPRPAPSTRSSG